MSLRAPRGTRTAGFETVTVPYIIHGTFRHQDSNGSDGLITNGDPAKRGEDLALHGEVL